MHRTSDSRTLCGQDHHALVAVETFYFFAKVTIITSSTPRPQVVPHSENYSGALDCSAMPYA